MRVTEAVTTVADTGAGISADFLPSVFELFAQSDHGQGGLGIGLALVRRLAELHGGSVQVASEGPGLGTTATVRLPILHVAMSEPAAEPPEAVLAATR